MKRPEPHPSPPIVTWLGWYGAAAILLAYLLVSVGRLGAHNIWYQLLNLSGAFGLLTEAIAHRDQPVATLNAVWIIVGIVALVGILVGK